MCFYNSFTPLKDSEKKIKAKPKNDKKRRNYRWKFNHQCDETTKRVTEKSNFVEFQKLAWNKETRANTNKNVPITKS